ncbi:hypothetical protein TcasGA2_TC031223 [Tribolium castaneum]|uniref:Uncharacterized protein n=1 Tax=Tribolium castaneum TaxID=7070 RepID=A0A139W922_TRICA|nr:hypothetical protein TcasGA2_TC031223 [Tribolium castaneum]
MHPLTGSEESFSYSRSSLQLQTNTTLFTLSQKC